MKEIARRAMMIVARIWAFLWQEKLPLWVTLMLTIGGGYFIAPFINQEIQRETLRREFLVKSLDGLSNDTIKIVMGANQIVSGSDSPANRASVADKIIELQYKLVRLNISTPDRRSAGVKVQKSLDELLDAVRTGDPSNVATTLREFSTLSFGLYEAIVKDARLL